MSLWRDIAGILAKEASYRAAKKAKASGRRRLIGAGGFVKSNLLMLMVSVCVSMMIGMPLMVPNPPAEAVVPIAGILGLVELLLGAFTMAHSIHIIATDRLLEPLTSLPVSEKDVRRALLAVGLYWGGLGLPFLVIPAMAVAAWKLGKPLLLFWGVVEGVTLLLLATGLGYIAGSLAPKTTRNPLLRAVSTISWLLFFGMGMAFSFVSRISAGLHVSASLLELLPPFSFAAAGFRSIASTLVSLSFLALSALTFKLGAGRLWRAASTGWSMPGPVVTPREWRLWRGPVPPPLTKDLKLMLRNPRMLAATFYYMLMGPLFFLFPILTGAKGGAPSLGEVLPSITLFIGGMGGWAVEYMYVVEGEGARLLYLLPVSRGRLVEWKASVTTMLGLPVGVAITLAAAWLWGPSIGISAGVTYVLALAGSTMINSLILANQLPREPSSWTQQTFSRGVMLLLFLAELALSAVLAGVSALPFLLNLLGFGAGPLSLLPGPKVIAPLEAAALLAAARVISRHSRGSL
ncbi:MAG TPA: hypothetical protein ENG69_01135 [Candidatus Korarchaeota archaeon]|nr:hypothetical protein [Candidatus Korarchaeota archaeon]